MISLHLMWEILKKILPSHWTKSVLENLYWVVPEKSHTPQQMGFWKFLQERGSKTLEVQAGGGVELEEPEGLNFWRGHFD